MPTVSIQNKKQNHSSRSSTEDLSTFELEKEEILYDGLERHGLKLPAGCLAGSCGTCRVNILKGNKDDLKPAGHIEQDTLNALKKEYIEKYGADFLNEKNIRLSCRARVLGDITIEIQKS